MKALFLFAALGAVAIATMAVSPNIDQAPRWMKGGACVGATCAKTAANNITDTRVCGGTWDFGTICNNVGCIPSRDSDPFTCTGARLSDTCLVSTDFGMDGGGIGGSDGGQVAFADVLFTCRVNQANQCVVNARSNLTDAGSSDMIDGGFFCRTLSNVLPLR